MAVNGDVSESAFNTGYNTGILAGDDVDLDDSIVGNGNTQLNDIHVGAFAARGNATNADRRERQLSAPATCWTWTPRAMPRSLNGNGNDFMGDVDTDLHNVDGPINLAIGDGNRQSALEDNTTTYEDSYNTDNSTDGLLQQPYRGLLQRDLRGQRHHRRPRSRTPTTRSTRTTTPTSWDWDSHDETTSTYEDNDTYKAELDLSEQHVDVWGDDNDVDLEA